jgi:hypothetical protein
MKTKRWLVYAVVELCEGCATAEKKTAVIAPPALPAKPAVPIAGTQLDQNNTEKVRYGDAMKAYSINRYADPNDPNVMHEGHRCERHLLRHDLRVGRKS